jgi:hypothetical protein
LIQFYSKEVYDIYKIRKGDSAVVRILADTLFKKMGRELPAFIKKGEIRLPPVSKWWISSTSTQKAKQLMKAAMLEANTKDLSQKQIKVYRRRFSQQES